MTYAPDKLTVKVFIVSIASDNLLYVKFILGNTVDLDLTYR